MNKKPQILIADDDSDIRTSVQLALAGEPYDILEAGSLKEAYEIIKSHKLDMLLLDVHFQNEGTCLELMKQLRNEDILTPIVVLSGAASANEANEALKLGAYDFIEKPVSADRLKITLSRCLENSNLKQKLHNYIGQDDILGTSNSIIHIRKQIDQFAKRNIKILIMGETGVGKEVIARSIWKNSNRNTQPLIVVNSAAIPANLMESELFGHNKGAFTGAVSDQTGKIEIADGGTLFLDEIGELSIEGQTKLLRFLETGEIQKVGSVKISKADVRVIAATSRDLEEEVKQGRFRADLFYRLNVVSIKIPPLRDRLEDIPILFSKFIGEFSQKIDQQKSIDIDSKVFTLLQNYNWPGNVRELRNVSERAIIVADSDISLGTIVKVMGKKILDNSDYDGNDIDYDCGDDYQHKQDKEDYLTFKLEHPVSLKEFKNQSETAYIKKVLDSNQYSFSKAASVLQIDRSYLYQKMNMLGISKKE